MSAPQRLDAALADFGYAPSRTRAAVLIHEGRVFVEGKPATKPSVKIKPGASIVIQEHAEDRWVGRAAGKLHAALERLSTHGIRLPINGATCMDAGASTGGFTQVLLDHGAERVYAVDVGHGQLHPSLASDARVVNREGVNVRHLEPGFIPGGVDVVVGDLSFISLTLVLEPLAAQLKEGGRMMMLVKPQFEVGRSGLNKAGVVVHPALRRHAVTKVVDFAEQAGLGLEPVAVLRSEVPGQDGNVEFFVMWIKENTTETDSSTRERNLTALLDAVDYS
ncbi:TlyA family RNA methyltransferase [Arthrobacter sp. HMSC06H05]|uniref:TlyA family RNA methyltransferase n=1 Tax=Arthrobacter sp. HMSC06H05 TaxID=1581128 RepID=UPI0008A33915|nr:TlyA family RNA methyltransferase [Arthrobacter sp. HMSC06H05]